jgi:hypothetical protein
MGNEEILLHFRMIHINIYVNHAWVGSGMSGKVSLRGQYRANFSDSDGL